MKATSEQIDGLKELINIGVGKAAGILNTMLNSHIRLNVPQVLILDQKGFNREIGFLSDEQLAAVELGFKGNLSGTAQLIFTMDTAAKLVTTLVGEEPDADEIDSIQAGTLTEIGNILLNGIIGSISNMLSLHLSYNVPNYLEGKTRDILNPNFFSTERAILLARTRFFVEALEIEGDIALFFELSVFNKLLAAIDGLSGTCPSAK